MTAFSLNGDDISLERALAWSAIEDSDPFLQLTIERAILIQHSIRSGIDVSSEEMQTAVDAFRVEAGLTSADETRRWLKANRMDERALVDACRLRVLREKLLASIGDEEVEADYNDHREDFETAMLYCMTLATRKEAERMSELLRSGKMNFHLAALEHSIDEQTRPAAGYLGEVTRDEVPETVALSVFSVDAGDIVGPLKTHAGYDIYLVAGFRRLSLEDAAADIRETLMAEKLDSLIRQSVVLMPEKADRL